MGLVLWHVTMSVDGFIAGPDDAMDWVFEYTGPNRVVEETLDSTGAILSGRRSYEVGVRAGVKPYGGAWLGPQFVLTHKPPDGPPDPAVTFLSTDVATAVARAVAIAGRRRNVVVFGADVARQCLDEGLVDEILIHLAPVLLGDGIRLFDVTGGNRRRLEPMSVSPAGRVTNLRFRVAR